MIRPRDFRRDIDMDKATYLQSFRADTAAIAAAARRGALTPIPSCPGWTLTSLLCHLGIVYLSIAKNIRYGNGEDIVTEIEDLDLSPPYVAWLEGGDRDEDAPPDAIEWFEGVSTRLADVFEETDPTERSWTWFPEDQTAGFWLRRMTHETIVHRWDAELAHGHPDGIDSDLAADGVDEALFIYQSYHCRSQSTVEGSG